ncbi:Uncharacterised protein [Bordetella pertussis]|nr:Uncharacterised protein [Bordetella pertussis]
MRASGPGRRVAQCAAAGGVAGKWRACLLSRVWRAHKPNARPPRTRPAAWPGVRDRARRWRPGHAPPAARNVAPTDGRARRKAWCGWQELWRS